MNDDDDDDFLLLMENLDEPPMSLDERAERIAAQLESGNASDAFLKELAEAIRPSGKSINYSFKLQHRSRGRPQGNGWRIGYAMMHYVDYKKCSVDEAVYQIQRIYGSKGNSRSKCLEALRIARSTERVWGALTRKSPDGGPA